MQVSLKLPRNDQWIGPGGINGAEEKVMEDFGKVELVSVAFACFVGGPLESVSSSRCCLLDVSALGVFVCCLHTSLYLTKLTRLTYIIAAINIIS